MSKVTLIASTSGIRGIVGSGIDPMVVTRYALAFGTLLKKGPVVVGRDSRPSGAIFVKSVIAGLNGTGIDVIDLGIVPTPTVEIAIKKLKATGGVCVTASHNPAQWNALKFFNDRGEFITPAQYRKLDSIYTSGRFTTCPYSSLGTTTTQSDWIDKHIEATLTACRRVTKKLTGRRLKIVVDAINSAGSMALPKLLRRLGVRVIEINCKGDGDFVHEPEPIPKNLNQLCKAVIKHKADLGMACDPDADRLALVDENGNPIGEELTLTIAVKTVLSKVKGPTVINLSTSSVTADVARSMASKVYYAKVGEANVVQMMRSRGAVIGGEGNGGVILPSFHAGRDALVAAVLTLACLRQYNVSLSKLAGSFPKYYNIKGKAPLPGNFVRRLKLFERTADKMIGSYKLDRRDGLRFDFTSGWLQIRSSNTEPIYRLIVETSNQELTTKLFRDVKRFFKNK